MFRFAIVLFVLLISSTVAVAQYTVNVSVDSDDRAVKRVFTEALLAELSKKKDIILNSQGEFELKADIMSRKTSAGDSDVFISSVVISRELCILEMDYKGRVVSRRPCSELLTRDSYVGRKYEVAKISAEIANKFDRFVIDPLRAINSEL